MEELIKDTKVIADAFWGIPSIILLVGTGLYLSIRLKLIQFRGFKHALKLISGKHDKPRDPGEISHFQALVTALSATIGTGNIAGVATAVAGGGAGALFWMWITALVGMATKYASCTLAVKYRTVHDDGTVAGGPMYTLQNGLNMKWLGVLFALFTLIASFGIGNMVQANSVVDGLQRAVPGMIGWKMTFIGLTIGMDFIVGLILAIATGLVIIGGLKRIAKVASYIVPFMAIAYCLAALIIIITNIKEIPAAFVTIFNEALNPYAAGWGAIGNAVQWGVKRGVFSNESGLGSAPMAHAGAKTKEPVREGLVASIGPFIDTIIICSMTGLVIVLMGDYGKSAPLDMLTGKPINGAELSAYSFNKGLLNGIGVDHLGAIIVGFGLVFFAYSTLVSWSYYGARGFEFLFGRKLVILYQIIYIILIVVGATIKLELVWNLADIANMLMALPNLISLILMAGIVKKLTDQYFVTYKNLI